MMIDTSPYFLKRGPLASALLMGGFAGAYAYTIPLLPWVFWPSFMLMLWYAGWLTYAGVAAASYSTLPMFLVLLTTTGVLIFYYRHTFRGLRTLRAQEREQGVFYTFENIEEIREARSRWWLVRLYRWASSLRRSRQ